MHIIYIMCHKKCDVKEKHGILLYKERQIKTYMRSHIWEGGSNELYYTY